MTHPQADPASNLLALRALADFWVDMGLEEARALRTWRPAGAPAAAPRAAIAAPPGPTSIGEFYYYFDAAGKVIGYRAIKCDGTFVSTGKTSTRYSNGYAFCDPRI